LSLFLFKLDSVSSWKQSWHTYSTDCLLSAALL